MKDNLKYRIRNLELIRILIVLLFTIHYSLFTAFGQDGKAIFTRECIACHNIGGGKKVGPDLQGVTKKRDINWLSKFINNSQEFIASGDPEAKKIFEEFNKIPMPSHEFTKAEITALVNYINNPNQSTEALKKTPPLFSPNAETGKRLFTGKIKLEHNGPSCITCHNVKYEGVSSGGTFAKDLSSSYSEEIVDSMIASLPAMRCSFKNHEVTFTEKSHLEAFLKSVKENQFYAYPNQSDSFLILWGTIVAFTLLLIRKVLWKQKKFKDLVDEMYNRNETSDPR
jgi:mono/diheme cytochrome c family protein